MTLQICKFLDKHFIPTWRNPFHLYSIRGITVGAVLSALAMALALVYGSTDTYQHSLLPHWVTFLILLIIFLSSFIGRLWKQGGKDDE